MNWITLDAQGYAAAKYLLAVLWQSSLLFAGVTGIVLLLRHHAPWMRRKLWLTALLVAPLLPLLSTMAKPSGLPQQELAAFPTYTPPVLRTKPAVEVHPSEIVISKHSITPLPVPTPRPIDYPWALALLAYALGSAGFLSWTLLGHLRIRQWIQTGTAPSEPRVLEAFREAATRLKLQRRVHVVMTDRVCAPVTVGLFRATVLLPKEVTATLTNEDLVAVAIHEMAHIRQHDPLFLTVASLIRSLLFFHPLVWVACRALAVLAEHVADDAVLETTGQPLPYAKLLTSLAERLPRRTPAVEGAAGLILCKSAFLRRVEAILGDRTRIRRITRWTLAASLAGCLVVIGGVLAVPLAQRAPQESKRDWKAGESVSGLQVSIAISKTEFGKQEPIPVHCRIKNVGRKPQTILWGETAHSCPIVFEITKPGGEKHRFEDIRAADLNGHPIPPTAVILQPGEFREKEVNLRAMGLYPKEAEGNYTAQGFYAPHDSQMVMYWIEHEKIPLPKEVFLEPVSAPAITLTLTGDLAWLQNQLGAAEFNKRLEAAKELVEPLGKDRVLAELEKQYPPVDPDPLKRLILVDFMARLGSRSHVNDILDLYEAGTFARYETEYEGTRVRKFLLQWGGDRERKRLQRYLQDNLGQLENEAVDTVLFKQFLQALVETPDPVENDFTPDKTAAPLMVLVLDVKTPTLKERRRINDASGAVHEVSVRWCDEAAMMLQKVLGRDWGFTYDKAINERDAIITLIHTELSDLVQPVIQDIQRIKANTIEGPFALDQEQVLPIEMWDKKPLAEAPRLLFSQVKETLNGTVHLAYPSWPHTRWNARLELLDHEGKVVANASQTVESSGNIEKVPEKEKGDLAFSFSVNQRDNARSFRFSMETVWTENSTAFQFDKDTPITLSLDSPEFADILRINRVRVEHQGQNFMVKMNTSFLSGPKIIWRTTVHLNDAEGKEVGKGEMKTKNIGPHVQYNRDNPARTSSESGLGIDGDHDAIERAKNITITLEKIDAGTPSVTVDTVDSAGNVKRRMAIADLVKTLDGDQPHLREAALNTLKEMGPEAQEAIPALIKALSAYPDHSSCHWIASEILAGLGALAVPALEQAVKSDDALLRIWANAALLSNSEADPTRWQCLSEALQSKDKITYQEALKAVQMLGPKAAPLVPQVTEILRRPNLYFMDTENALTALARIGSAASPAFPEVIKWLDAAEPLVRVEALRAVKVMDKADRKLALPKLVLALGANDTSESFVASQQSHIRAEAAEVLGSMGSEARETLPNLIKALDDPNEFVCAAAIEAIGRIDPADPTVLPGLIKAMQDPNVRVQHPANRILMELGPVNIDVIRAFIQAIRENGNSFDTNGYDGPAYNIVPASEGFIQKLKPEHRYVVPDFIALAKDPNPGVQRMAITALTKIGEIPEELIPMLMENVRKSASCWSVDALILLGPKVSAEVPALIKMLRSPDLSVSVAAARILAAIGRPAAEPAISVMEECIKAAKFPQDSLCQSLLTLDPSSTVARDGLARIPARPGAENKQSTYKLSDNTITRAKEAAKAELDVRKKPGHGLRDRRPAGLEKADSDAAIAQIIETSMTESVSSDESIREAALRRLCYLGDRAFEALAKGLKSDNPNVRAVSASRLQGCGTKATPLLSQALLNDSDITVRTYAAQSLGNMFDPKGIPALLTALQDPEFRVTMSAIMALMFQRNHDAFEPLRAILDNPKADAQLREAAAKALRHIDPANGTKAVQEAIEKEKDESLRHNYKVVLNESPFDYDYWPAELLALHQLTQDAATLAGEQFGDAEIKQLVEYIHSDTGTAPFACLLALGALRVESAVPAIIALGPGKSCVCSALAEIASPEAVAFLLDVLQSPVPEIRKGAIRALGEHAGRWAVPVLVELLDDPGLRKKGSSDNGMEWPDEHEAHAALWTCLSRSGLKNSILNLADSQGRTLNVDEEIKRTKVWWQEHGEDFLQGKSVPSPNLTMVWWIS